MLVNLFDIWNKHNKDSDEKYQNTFVFETSPKCVFVKNKSLEVALTYNDLEELQLSKLEQIEAEKKEKQILESGGYNGNLFFVKNLIYDPNNNILYIHLLRTKFSVISSLSLVRRLKLGLYKVGVLSPTITTDNDIVCLERSSVNKFYSVVSGFLEQKTENEQIGDLIKTTAMEENAEELYENRFDLSKFQLTGISFTRSRGFIEFIVNFQDRQISTFVFLDLFKNSMAKDRQEHTNNYFVVPLSKQTELLKKLYEQKPGEFLYIPITMCNSKIVHNQNIIFDSPNPNSLVSKFTSLTDSQFKTTIPSQIGYMQECHKKKDKKQQKIR